MAGVDYENCGTCGARIFYNPYDGNGEPLVHIMTEGNLYCSKCIKKLIKQIEKCRKELTRRK